MIARNFVVAGILAFATLPARSQDVKILSLAEARQITIKNHPKITAAELLALASRQAVRAGGGPWWRSRG